MTPKRSSKNTEKPKTGDRNMFTIESDFNLAKFFKENDIAFNENFPANEGCKHEYILHGHTPCSVIFEIGNVFNANYIAIETGFAFKAIDDFSEFMIEIDHILMRRTGLKSASFIEWDWKNMYDKNLSAEEAVSTFFILESTKN